MTTAIEDGRIRRNPCHIKGAGQEHSDERPVVPIATLVQLLDNVSERYRALLLLATFANSRFGELAGLRRNQLNLDACEVRVNASTWEMDDGRLIDGDPKSDAGNRTIAFPRDIVPELADHLEHFADPEPNGLVFIGPKGGRLRRSNFRKFWYQARGVVGMPELHFLKVPGFQHLLHEPEEPVVTDVLRQRREHDLIVERPEAVGDVAFNEPGCPGPGFCHFRMSGVASPADQDGRPSGLFFPFFFGM